jgi:hypothetical protein
MTAVCKLVLTVADRSIGSGITGKALGLAPLPPGRLAAELGLLATLTLAINAHSNENIAVRTADFRK